VAPRRSEPRIPRRGSPHGLGTLLYVPLLYWRRLADFPSAGPLAPKLRCDQLNLVGLDFLARCCCCDPAIAPEAGLGRVQTLASALGLVMPLPPAFEGPAARAAQAAGLLGFLAMF